MLLGEVKIHDQPTFKECERSLGPAWRDAFCDKRDGYITWLLFPCMAGNVTPVLKYLGKKESLAKGRKVGRFFFFEWCFFPPSVWKKQR